MFTDKRLTWEDLNEILLTEFPSLKTKKFTERIGGLEEWNPGQFVVFGSLFTAYLREQKANLPEERAKIGAFLERMATSNVELIEDLLKIDVLGVFLESQDMIAAYWPYLGPRTRFLIDLLAPRIASSIQIPRA